MLLRHGADDGVEVLSVDGRVEDADAAPLLAAVEAAVAGQPRGVVLDLGAVSGVSDTARVALRDLGAVPCGWPLTALVVCPPTDQVPRDQLGLTGVPQASDVRAAMERVEERSGRQRARLRVEHGPQGPGHARAAVVACSTRLGLDDLEDDVVLLVSELVTNAVRHAAPPVDLEIEADDGEVVVAVRDGSPHCPAARSVDEEAEGGRGMLLVDMLTSEHGVRAQPPGKTVWARLRHLRG